MESADHVEDDKLLSRLRLISKESAMGPDAVNPPSRVCTYYGGVSAGVPFHWESKPGTPKHSSSSDTTSSCPLFPPLNPPPCYTSRNTPQWQSPIKRRSGSFAFRSLFQRKFPNLIVRKRSHRSDHVPVIEAFSSSSSTSSASSAPSSPVKRPLSVFKRSHSTSTRRNSMADYEFYDDKTSISRVSTDCSPRCFWN